MSQRGQLRRTQQRFAYSIMTPIMLYLMLFSLIPMIWAIVLGFFEYSPVRAGGEWFGLGADNPFIGINNYIAMFGDTQAAQLLRKSLGNTFLFRSWYCH